MNYIHVDVQQFGAPEQLTVVEESVLPEPGPGEVRVKVLTAGTGFTDTIIRKGQYIDVKKKPPFTVGYDWFGVVDKLGEGVQELAPGQYVADLSIIGGYTQYLCVAAERVIPAPEGLDPAAAVAMILTYTTAYQMLTRIRPLPAGTTCLVHAAGGAVGTALLELGRRMGLKMVGTASRAKHAIVRRLGGIPIDYRSTDFVAEINRLTLGEGVDVVFDTIGGAHWSRSRRCVKKGGLLICFGVLQYTTGEENALASAWGFIKLKLLWQLFPQGKAAVFYNIAHRRERYPQQFKDDVQHLFSLLASHKLQPAIADVVPLEQAVEVHRRIDRADIEGKVILSCQP